MLADPGQSAGPDDGSGSDDSNGGDETTPAGVSGPETATATEESPHHPLDGAAKQLARRRESAFEQVYDAMADRLFRLALRMLGDHHEAQDVVQQAFLELARTEELPTGGRSLQAWLFSSVRFNCLDTQRYRGRRPAVPFGRIPETPDDDPQYDLGLDPQLEAALALLTPDQRLVVHLKHVEGLDGHEIAEIIGSNRSAVYAMAARAERRMRHYLEHGKPIGGSR